MSEPLISVFLPTHARFKRGLLSKSIESVLAQNHKNLELLIVDDASTDGAADYIEEIAKQDKRVKYLRFDKHVGLPACTLAYAYLQANGEFLAFAFDDTEWLPNHLETLIGYLQKNPLAGMAYGGVGIDLPGVKPQILGQQEYDLDKLLQFNYIGNCGVILKRSTIEQVGWYDPHILVKRCCDWDLWLRIGKSKIPVVYCPEIIAHEKGALLNDSIGSSVSLYDALTRKYQTTERNKFLAPNLIVEGKASMFEPCEWMSKEETNALRILVFEHYLRTSQLAEAVQLSKKWHNETPTDSVSGESDIEILNKSFNLYLAETRYSCRGTCESAYRLSDALSAYNTEKVCNDHLNYYYRQLSINHDDLMREYEQTDNSYHKVLRSFSWRITKPVREFKRICRENRHVYQTARSFLSTLRRSKIG